MPIRPTSLRDALAAQDPSLDRPAAVHQPALHPLLIKQRPLQPLLLLLFDRLCYFALLGGRCFYLLSLVVPSLIQQV